MATHAPKIVRLATANDVIADIRKTGRHVVTFLGFSGAGYEDPAGMRDTIEQLLARLDPASILVNAGGTGAGIGAVYSIAKRRGFSTVGIVSALAEREGAKLSPDADTIYIIPDEIWGGLMANGELSPTSLAMVEASDEMVAIGGDEITRDELLAAKAKNKRVRYIPADMDHAAAKRKAREKAQPQPRDFRGAAHSVAGAREAVEPQSRERAKRAN